MRFAPLWLAVLSACVHGNSGTVDAAGEGSDDAAPMPTQDSDMSCDGLQCDAIFVSKSGNDSGAGSRLEPLKTINAGIAKVLAALEGN